MDFPGPNLNRPTTSFGLIEVAHTESISDQEMDDTGLAELMADVGFQVEETILETQL
jgi:hypothetical protein